MNTRTSAGAPRAGSHHAPPDNNDNNNNENFLYFPNMHYSYIEDKIIIKLEYLKKTVHSYIPDVHGRLISRIKQNSACTELKGPIHPQNG